MYRETEVPLPFGVVATHVVSWLLAAAMAALGGFGLWYFSIFNPANRAESAQEGGSADMVVIVVVGLAFGLLAAGLAFGVFLYGAWGRARHGRYLPTRVAGWVNLAVVVPPCLLAAAASPSVVARSAAVVLAAAVLGVWLTTLRLPSTPS